MTVQRQRWVAWVLAAWLPVAGIASAAGNAMMAVPPAAPHSITTEASNLSPDPARGCHVAPVVVDEQTAAPCCDAGACFCSCAVSVATLVASVSPALVPMSRLDLRMAVGVPPAAPFTHPFRPPIV